MIRRYEEHDLDQVIDIWYKAQAVAHPFLTNEFIGEVKVMMREKFIPISKTWVFEKDGKIIGFVAMMDNEIGGLFVDIDFHAQGIGTELVNYVRPSYDTLEVEVFEKNNIGRNFYKKYGFKIIKSYTHEASKEVVLRLSTKDKEL